MGKVEGERLRSRRRALWVATRNSHPWVNYPIPWRAAAAEAEARGVRGPFLPLPRAAPPQVPLTCPMELGRRPPARAPPGPASRLQDTGVQPTLPLPELPPGLPSPEVFLLTSAFAASQMLKIPRHLSPGAYQGPEERGERRRRGFESPGQASGRGHRLGCRGASRGGGAVGTPAPGPGLPPSSRFRTRARRAPPRRQVPQPRREAAPFPAARHLSSARSGPAGGRSVPGDPGAIAGTEARGGLAVPSLVRTAAGRAGVAPPPAPAHCPPGPGRGARPGGQGAGRW